MSEKKRHDAPCSIGDLRQALHEQDKSLRAELDRRFGSIAPPPPLDLHDPDVPALRQRVEEFTGLLDALRRKVAAVESVTVEPANQNAQVIALGEEAVRVSKDIREDVQGIRADAEEAQRLARDLIRGIPGIFHVLLADPEVAAPTCLGTNCTTRPGTAFPVMRLEARTWRYDSLRFCCDDHTADMGYWFDGKSDLAWAVKNAPPYPRVDIAILGPMRSAFLARLARTPEHPWVMVRPETLREVSP